MSRRVDLVLGLVCVLFVVEAIFLAPLNADAAFTLRQGSAQADGAVPCRDIHCEYTPLATTILAVARGSLIPSLLIVQVVILACGLLTSRLARTLGFDSATARSAGLLAWALLLANDGRAIEVEPFALVFLLLAADSFAASGPGSWTFPSGLLVAAAFWVKQYGLLGWAGLLGASLLGRRARAAAGLTLGVATGVISGLLILLVLGADPASLGGLFNASGYPSHPILENLTAAPELLGMLLLSLAALAADRGNSGLPGGLRLPLAMIVASLLPFTFRGYRHYWQLVVPFLALLSLRPWAEAGKTWVPLARRAAIGLGILSVGLDGGRVARDVVTDARSAQFAAAQSLAAIGGTSTRVLYLVDPALLPLLKAPILALREVGPKFTRFSRNESAAVLAAADAVVWDTSWPGADELLLRLSTDPAAELARRGFVRTRIHGGVHVYEREK